MKDDFELDEVGMFILNHIYEMIAVAFKAYHDFIFYFSKTVVIRHEGCHAYIGTVRLDTFGMVTMLPTFEIARIGDRKLPAING